MAIPAAHETAPGQGRDVRDAAAMTLGKFGPEAKAAVPRSRNCSGRRTPAFVLLPPSALGEIGGEARRAVPVSAELLKDEDRLSPAAIEALGNSLQGEGGSCGPHGILKVKEFPERQYAIRALGGWYRRRNRLFRRWRKYSRTKTIADVAASALGQIGPEAKTAVPALIEATQGHARLRGTVVWALGQIGPEAKAAIPAMAALPRDNASNAVVDVLGEHGSGPPFRRSLELLHDKDANSQWYVACVLAKMGPAAVPALIQGAGWTRTPTFAAMRPMPWDRWLLEPGQPFQPLWNRSGTATRGFQRPPPGLWGQSVRKPSAALTKLLQDKDAEICRCAAGVLGEIGSQGESRSAPCWQNCSRTKTTWSGQGACLALGAIGPGAKAAVPPLRYCSRTKTPTFAGGRLGFDGDGFRGEGGGSGPHGVA